MHVAKMHGVGEATPLKASRRCMALLGIRLPWRQDWLGPLPGLGIDRMVRGWFAQPTSWWGGGVQTVLAIRIIPTPLPQYWTGLVFNQINARVWTPCLDSLHDLLGNSNGTVNIFLSMRQGCEASLIL